MSNAVPTSRHTLDLAHATLIASLLSRTASAIQCADYGRALTLLESVFERIEAAIAHVAADLLMRAARLAEALAVIADGLTRTEACR